MVVAVAKAAKKKVAVVAAKAAKVVVTAKVVKVVVVATAVALTYAVSKAIGIAMDPTECLVLALLVAALLIEVLAYQLGCPHTPRLLRHMQV